MKRSISILATVAMLVMFAAGCNVASAEAYPDTLEILWTPNGTPPDEPGLYPQTYLEQKFNVKLNYVQLDPQQREQQLATMFASKEVPDLLVATSADMLSGYQQNGFIREIPLEKVKELMPTYYSYCMEMDPNLFEYASVDGVLYGLPIPNVSGKYPSPVVFKADWLAKLNMAAPSTIEEMEALFVAIRDNDPDGNGQKDSYGISAPAGTQGIDASALFTPVFGAYGAIPGMWMEKDGKIINGFEDPGYLEALKLLADWYQKGFVDPEFVTDMSSDRTGGPSDLASKFGKGRIGVLYHFSSAEYTWAEQVIDPAEAEATARVQQYNADWAALGQDGLFAAATKGITGPGGANGMVRRGVARQYACVGALTDDATLDRLLAICEAVSTDPETYTRSASGEEGVQWDWVDCTNKFATSDGKTALWSQAANDEFAGSAAKNVTKIGTSSFFNPWINWTTQMYPYWAGTILGARIELNEKIADIPSYENPVKASLPSVALYPDLPQMIKDFTIQAIAGKFADIDAQYASVLAAWKTGGGDQLTQEANAALGK